jgi:catechol 2,3-dioxygenase-like lactoylglutathione lyase family enzyme
MLADSKAFSGFAVKDLEEARAFYGDTLGLETSEENGLLTLHLAGDRGTLVRAGRRSRGSPTRRATSSPCSRCSRRDQRASPATAPAGPLAQHVPGTQSTAS